MYDARAAELDGRPVAQGRAARRRPRSIAGGAAPPLRAAQDQGEQARTRTTRGGAARPDARTRNRTLDFAATPLLYSKTRRAMTDSARDARRRASRSPRAGSSPAALAQRHATGEEGGCSEGEGDGCLANARATESHHNATRAARAAVRRSGAADRRERRRRARAAEARGRSSCARRDAVDGAAPPRARPPAPAALTRATARSAGRGRRVRQRARLRIPPALT